MHCVLFTEFDRALFLCNNQIKLHERSGIKMKKSFLFVGMLLMLCIALFGCGKSNNPADLSDPKPEHYDVELNDLVLYDKNDILILAKGYCDDGERGGKLYMKIFNNSDTDIDVTADRDFTVNDYVIGFIGNINNCYTPAGTSRFYALSFEDQYLEELDIEEIWKLTVQVKIGIIEDHTGTGILDHSDPVEIVLREGNPDDVPDGETVYDEDGIRILYLDYEEGGNFYRAHFYVENNSGHDITITRCPAAENEYTGWHSDADYADGSRGIMGVVLDDDKHEIDHDDLEYMMVSVTIRDSDTDELLGGFDDYIVKFD